MAASDMHRPHLVGYGLRAGRRHWFARDRNRELKPEGGADTELALGVHLAAVLLDDAVGDGESEAGALVLPLPGRGFGGEERIVDAVHVLGRDAAAAVLDEDLGQAV